MRAGKFLLFIMCFFYLSFVWADTTSLDVAGGDEGSDEQQIYNLYEGIDLATTLKFEYAKPKIVIKSVFPRLKSDDQQNDESVENFNQLVAQLLKIEVDKFKQDVVEVKPLQANLPANVPKKNELYIDYDSSFININGEHILSIRFSFAGMIGGSAHGFHFHRTLTYDLDVGEEITLADLFKPDSDYLNKLSEYTRQTLSKRLKNSDQMQEMINAGTRPIADNFRNWNIKPRGIVITFDESQVAPRVYGAKTVIIPYSVLADMIDPDAPIYTCLKHRVQCTWRTLLTGGFMDEA